MQAEERRAPADLRHRLLAGLGRPGLADERGEFTLLGNEREHPGALAQGRDGDLVKLHGQRHRRLELLRRQRGSARPGRAEGRVRGLALDHQRRGLDLIAGAELHAQRVTPREKALHGGVNHRGTAAADGDRALGHEEAGRGLNRDGQLLVHLPPVVRVDAQSPAVRAAHLPAVGGADLDAVHLHEKLALGAQDARAGIEQALRLPAIGQGLRQLRGVIGGLVGGWLKGLEAHLVNQPGPLAQGAEGQANCPGWRREDRQLDAVPARGAQALRLEDKLGFGLRVGVGHEGDCQACLRGVGRVALRHEGHPLPASDAVTRGGHVGDDPTVA